MLKKDDARRSEIIRRLKENYPDAHCALTHTNAFQLLVATILSAQCTDERVNRVTQTLFRQYPQPQDFARAPIEELEQAVRPTGFYRNKAKNIKQTARRIVEEFDGEVPRTIEELLTLSGVARKTANVVLGNWFGIASGIVVDTHVSRLSQRLALTENETPERIEQDLQRIVPPNDWIQFSHWLIEHGRRICQARRPKCAECFLEDSCPSSNLKVKADN